ncbi:putative Small nuclear ribonucleoprotein E [Blattamonas nauphoetae]|uniref:Small nuclear ribonucleoprotein E n=1 Tax=Blattamonas nauphoetae TaxID=2049346 RepID=A0ABQ9YLP6_9EUKA|nr:putative Small nuclear ribonucleoprotein E [Blattamonas nauphoetae]
MSRQPKKASASPINVIFKFFREQTRVEIWLYENTRMRIEGVIRGFDEFMNIVLSDACEVHVKTGKRDPLHTILLKADTIVSLCPAQLQE